MHHEQPNILRDIRDALEWPIERVAATAGIASLHEILRLERAKVFPAQDYAAGLILDIAVRRGLIVYDGGIMRVVGRSSPEVLDPIIAQLSKRDIKELIDMPADGVGREFSMPLRDTAQQDSWDKIHRLELTQVGPSLVGAIYDGETGWKENGMFRVRRSKRGNAVVGRLGEQATAGRTQAALNPPEPQS